MFLKGLSANRYRIGLTPGPEVAGGLHPNDWEVLQQAQTPPTRPAPPMANTAARLPVQVPQKEEAVYLKLYNAVLIRKLEAKMQQLEQAMDQGIS